MVDPTNKFSFIDIVQTDLSADRTNICPMRKFDCNESFGQTGLTEQNFLFTQQRNPDPMSSTYEETCLSCTKQ